MMKKEISAWKFSVFQFRQKQIGFFNQAVGLINRKALQMHLHWSENEAK